MEVDNSRMGADDSVIIAVDGVLNVHQVVLPPYKSTLQRLGTKLKETFFPDDPLRQFKGHPPKKKLILGIKYVFPIFHWVPHYTLKLFKADLISGLTIASLAIPQGISYANLANLPAIQGLYSSFVPPLVYVVLGSSMDLAVGPVSIASLVMGSMLAEEVSPTAQPDLYLRLALTSTLFAGIFQTTLGILSIKKPRLFWVSAGAPLLSVIISTVLSFVINAPRHDISVIGKLPHGVNPPSADKLLFSGNHIGLVMKTGLITGVLSLTEGIAVGRTFATIRNYRVDGNKEMIAIGIMNVIGCTTSCYVTTGSFSRSAINHNAGARTAMSNAVMSVTVLVTLLFLMPLFQYTPNVILGAIIIAAVIGLIDIGSARVIWKLDKFDFVVMMTSFFGVIFISVQWGLAIAVALSVFRILLQVTRPKTVMLGKIPETIIYRNLHHYKEAERVPGFLILSIESPINFANITYLHERILRWVEEEEEEANKQQRLQFVILDMTAVSNIDTSGVSLFKDLKTALTIKGLVIVNPLADVIAKMRVADEANECLQPDTLFLTVAEAVTSLSSTIMKEGQSPTMQENHTIED
ncbi:hypothetical protein Fmac_006025 [Flemingia macrophylla]|uniref:STAS domain-containing protein n=1 Tax=Flemingia macrophylla TaxID=520843 RepID=A0ABD1N9J8_9FABA